MDIVSAPVVSCMACMATYTSAETRPLVRSDDDGWSSVICTCGACMRVGTELLESEILLPMAHWRRMHPRSTRGAVAYELEGQRSGWLALLALTLACLIMLVVLLWI